MGRIIADPASIATDSGAALVRLLSGR